MPFSFLTDAPSQLEISLIFLCGTVDLILIETGSQTAKLMSVYVESVAKKSDKGLRCAWDKNYDFP